MNSLRAFRPLSWVLLLWLPVSTPTKAGSPILIQGDAIIPSSGVPLSPASVADFQIFINKAKEIAPLQAAALEGKVLSGEIGVAWLWGGGQGVHDWNTIAIRRGSVVVGAVALLHEFQHVMNCLGGPPNGGAEADGSSCDPCYACTHRDIQAQSHAQLLALVCTLPTEEEREELCNLIRGTALVGKRYAQQCTLIPNCSYHSFYDWNTLCPTCN